MNEVTRANASLVASHLSYTLFLRTLESADLFLTALKYRLLILTKAPRKCTSDPMED